jgi:hypothetical protein
MVEDIKRDFSIRKPAGALLNRTSQELRTACKKLSYKKGEIATWHLLTVSRFLSVYPWLP